MKNFVSTLLLVTVVTLTPGMGQAARAASLVGEITAEGSQQPLTGANVVLLGTGRGAATDLDGQFVIFGIEPGRYTVRVTMLGYSAKELADVEIEEGKNSLRIRLVNESVQLEKVTFTAGADKGSQERELEDRLGNSSITDAVSKEVLRKLPDPDVANVVRRTTGVAIKGGDPVIRGLGARYSKVTLNNAAVSGTEPNRSAVSLELFPASLMSQVTISKSYMADQNGEFAGGSVNMSTVDLPSSLEIAASVKTSYNSATTFREFLSYSGGGTDWMGYDDGSRALPELVGSAQEKIRLGNYNYTELQEFSRSFSNVWSPVSTTAAPNMSYSLSLGNRYNIGGRPFSFLVSGIYGNSRAAREIDRNVYTGGEVPGQVELWHDYQFQTYSNNVSLGSMASMKYQLTDYTNLSYNMLFSQDTENEVRKMEGYNDDRETNIRSTRLRFLSETTWTNQITGNTALPSLLGSTFDWQATYSRGDRYEPDTRETQYEEEGPGQYVFADETYSGARIFNEMDDHTWSASGDWTLRPFASDEDIELKLGGAATLRDRVSNYHRYEFEEAPNASFSAEQLTAAPEDLFQPGNLNSYGFLVSEYTRPNDSYTAEQQVYSGFMMAELPVSLRLFISGGLRIESSRQEVVGFEPFRPTDLAAIRSSELQTTDLLPALNMRYTLMPRMNLRFAASQTLSRPDFRELAEFEFTDFVGGRSVIGNPDLKRALIRNYDLRWEMVHGVADLLAASIFYKQFANPIETVIQNTAQNRTSYDNAKAAHNYGIELEMRQNLGRISDALRSFTVTTNLALIQSQVELNPELVTIQTSQDRALAGQSPYLFNFGLGYMHPLTGTQLNAFFNTFGRRIDEVGANGLPDVYEMPFHDLDLTARQPLTPKLALSLAFKNLLDANVRFEQGGEPTHAYRVGRSFSVGLSYSN